MPLSDEEKIRYRRNIILPQIGEAGQEKLLKSSVLIVGCGGLGSASSFYLCVAGVGRLGLMDSDRVEVSNLQRQILHGYNDIDRPKIESAGETLSSLNPFLKIEKYAERLTSDNIADIFSRYDLIIDACDNLETRYLMNRGAFSFKKPLILGAASEFWGQVTTIIPPEGPCYNCLYPEPDDIPLWARPGEIGVLGTTPGIVGMIQATEGIKVLLGVGEILQGRMLIYDGLKMMFKSFIYEKDPLCSVCNEKFIG